jgi:SAM-dependent methyltransferase
VEAIGVDDYASYRDRDDRRHFRKGIDMRDKDLVNLFEHHEDIEILRDYLRCSGYSSQAICDALDIAGTPHQILTNTAHCALIYYDEGQIDRSDMAALGTMFALGGWIKKARYERVLPTEVRLVLERYNLVEDADAQYIRGTIGLVEYESCFFLSDRMLERSPYNIRLTQEAHDHVDPPNYSSVSILGTQLERSILHNARLLDVGCGTGYQSILAATQYRDVVGIDVNTRAILFSKVNARLNEVDVTFQHHNCLLYEDSVPFDRIVFNVPSVPKYKPDLDKVDTYTYEFGYDLGLQFVNARLKALLAEYGMCRIWSIFAVRSADTTIEGILQRELKNYEDFDIEILIEQNSPFGMSPQDIQRRQVPRASYLLADPSHVEIYIDFLERHDIVRITPALVTIQLKKTPTHAVYVREVDSLVP